MDILKSGGQGDACRDDRDNSCLGRLYINKLELPTAEVSHALSHKSPLSVVVARLEFLH